ncbi:hypothetical protein GGX14DRAFT_404869 [Mycena pura]|uniref:Uncharacterized protein n=1 Tax=Mycena pura TaxID=153505 RepID=A0AAD6UWV2_9AGAR|nr:hypothetical protein GGX14DRAFT_404869 [Mycena pura]
MVEYHFRGRRSEWQFSIKRSQELIPAALGIHVACLVDDVSQRRTFEPMGGAMGLNEMLRVGTVIHQNGPIDFNDAIGFAQKHLLNFGCCVVNRTRMVQRAVVQVHANARGASQQTQRDAAHGGVEGKQKRVRPGRDFEDRLRGLTQPDSRHVTNQAEESPANSGQ